MIDISQQNMARLKLLALIVVFVFPIVLAQYLFHTGWTSQSRVNKGHLITPPISIETLNLNPIKHQAIPKKWLLMYSLPAKCDKRCQHDVFNMRQIRLTLGKEQDRVARLLLLPQQHQLPIKQIQTRYPKVLLFNITNDMQKHVAKQIKRKLTFLQHGVLFIVDPLGHIILFYPKTFKNSDVRNDLKYLLRYSHVG